MPSSNAKYAGWIGRSETVHDMLAEWPAMAAAAMLDVPKDAVHPGGALPPLWHWFYFLSCTPQRRLSPDGHPPRGDFLPPIPYPRRMIAGGRLTVHRPLQLGRAAERVSEVRDVRLRQGRSGALAFVRLGHRYAQAGALCIEEEQEIVYREPGPAVAPPQARPLPTPAPAVTVREVMADSRLLFRFSALTFNAHRIHYDRDYARTEEGYPGLVVHGPLIAMQLLMLACHVAVGRVHTFEYRSERPIFDLAPYRLQAQRVAGDVELAAVRGDGEVAQRARATFTVSDAP